MSKTGIGVMIKAAFGGNEQTVEALKAAIGQTIKKITHDETGDHALIFEFESGYSMRVYDDGRSCCESRYLTTDDDLVFFVGGKFLNAETKDGPNTDGEWGDTHEIQFLIVNTSKGAFTAETHNEHNGYYGGFWIAATEIKSDARKDE